MRIRSLACASLLALSFAPLAAHAALPEKIPADTLLYVGWPGSAKLSETYRDTAMSKIMAEPEMQKLRTQFLPAIDALILKQIGDDEDDKQAYAQVKQLLQAVYDYPTAVALISVDASTVIPLVNAGIIVEAGSESAKLGPALEAAFKDADVPVDKIKTVKVGRWEMRELAIMGPGMSLRWGVIDNAFVVSFGNQLLKHLVPEYLARPADEEAETEPADATAPAAQPTAKNLADNPLFQKAMQVTGGSNDVPVMFVNLESALRTVEAFQPMLAGFGLPVLGEEGGVRKALGELGLPDPRSFSIAWTAGGGGMQTNMFLHAPGMKANYKPLTQDDFRVIPATASWGSASQADLKGTYDAILKLVQTAVPDKHAEFMDILANVEERLGMKIGDDLLASFGDTWIVFDDPENGSLIITGITIVADVKPDNRVDEAIRTLVKIIAEETGSDEQITVKDEEYKGSKISYMNFSGLPVPIAPAWTVHEGRWILALYPQMVRATLDRLMDKQAKTLVDNQGFRDAWKVLPQNATSMNYIDAARGVRHLYSFVLPVSQAAVAMGQGEGLTLDITALPSLATINKHVFPSVSAGANTPDGYLFRSYSAVPGAVASLGQATVLAPLGASILLPSLARARELSKRTVSAANLKGIGLAALTYAEDNDGKFPPDLKTLIEAGSINQKTLISPLDDDPGEEGSYIYLGSGLTNEMDPGLIVAYEKTENAGGEGTTVLFLDGHVEFVTLDRFDELLEKNKDLTGTEDGEAEEEKQDKKPGKTPEELQEEREEKGEKEPRDAEEPADGPDAGAATDADARKTRNVVRITRAMVSTSGPIAMAIDTFRLEVGRYPQSLSELTNKPEDEDDDRKWNGPYIKDAKNLKDAWANPIGYASPGKHNESSYDLWSNGPDGKLGTKDDITNW